jgi:hypothetical protein
MSLFADDPRVAGSLLAEVECRASLCRLHIEHEDSHAKLDLIGAVGKPPLHVAGIRFPGTDPLLSSVVYLAREGDRLPHRRPGLDVIEANDDDNDDMDVEEGRPR